MYHFSYYIWSKIELKGPVLVEKVNLLKFELTWKTHTVFLAVIKRLRQAQVRAGSAGTGSGTNRPRPTRTLLYYF